MRNSNQGMSIADLVGAITSAPISNFRRVSLLRFKISNIGIPNAIVFPDPVVAWTQTSFQRTSWEERREERMTLWERKRGIVAACTGVVWWNPKDSTAFRASVDSAGIKSSNFGTAIQFSSPTPPGLCLVCLEIFSVCLCRLKICIGLKVEALWEAAGSNDSKRMAMIAMMTKRVMKSSKNQLGSHPFPIFFLSIELIYWWSHHDQGLFRQWRSPQ
jgi:hypothetical protein